MSVAGSPSITVRVVRRDGAVVLHVVGELDIATAPGLTESIADALREQPATLVVDLSAVKFLGSAGLSALIGAHDKAGDKTSVRVVASSPATLRPLEVTGLLTTISIHPSVESALAAPPGRSAG